MNILHYVTKKQEISPKLKKLKSISDAESQEDDAVDGAEKILDGESGAGLSPYDKEELEKRLSPAQFRVTQQLGTEKPFSGKYVKWKEEGVFNCVVCGTPLFSSETKFDSGSGWPAFYDVISKGKVLLKEENIGGLQRMEVKCRECKAHLGHVFDDGPKPTGIRYCVNSNSLDFRKHTTV
ncbi:peptide methionine sulfoxide reductase MsrB-like [Physella acuta]|uniref:peptide methionine sulfoxide reductase MsrB-like n=1 Tax=Physella acuta TaxID=109671 RepID=UPI0027DBEEE2|nr:peptide methionine sulfoxide reductase MsrB-like [Physella acuta]